MERSKIFPQFPQYEDYTVWMIDREARDQEAREIKQAEKDTNYQN